jgi:hypothetical protein
MAMRKLGNVLPPLVVVLVAVVPPEPALLLLLLPHADAISARPTAREAAVASHFHECLRFNFVTSRVSDSCRGQGAEMAKPSASAAFLLTFEQRS